MLWKQWWLVLLFLRANVALYCFNCSATHREWNYCGGDFVSSMLPFNSTRKNLVNCTGDNAMCFVRSWSARARHAWIVQRGCYLPTAQDTLPRSMNTPTRSMACKHERHPDAEYKICLCQADWCNSASASVPSLIQYLLKLPKYLIECTVAMYHTNPSDYVGVSVYFYEKDGKKCVCQWAASAARTWLFVDVHQSKHI